ncbi:MAG: A/G-specific adenine glycosylase [Alphaproteobacteria bacterium]|nr:A/G-specific adenine glycosylase [Alphaproteobacteria bacterium]
MANLKERSKAGEQKIHEIRGQLLGWYDRHRRDLPWRDQGGQKPDPYHVWLSEIMLQQTTVTAVRPYYTKFLAKWPTIRDLAEADEGEVMAAWAGLGYYARARNLHKCAKVVANDLDGIFPQEQNELKKLPGIGEYTSAAITAIAFNRPATVVDGNVERVMARLFNVRTPLPEAKKELKSLADLFFDSYAERPGDLAQAFMDLGAVICIPKAPRCSLCPLSKHCHAFKADAADELPLKSVAKKRPPKYGYVYWVENDKGEVLIHKRPAKGLLGGMLALPTSAWETKPPVADLTFLSVLEEEKSSVSHVFTHFELQLTPKKASLPKGQPLPEGFFWHDRINLKEKMPSLFQKAFSLFITKDQ